MKIDRLLALTIFLLNHGQTSSAELARRFEVSQRTIMRDLDTLCLAGIPVVAERGVAGGYRIMDSFVLERQVATTTDYSYIVAALEGLASAYNGKDLDTVLEKMRALAGSVSDDSCGGYSTYPERSASGFVHSAVVPTVDLSVARENLGVNEALFLLNRAIQLSRRVQFVYTNARDETRSVTAEPVTVIYKWYNWYLAAWDCGRGDYRMFKIVRLCALGIVPEEIKRPHSPRKVLACLETQRAKHEAGRMVEVTLRCSARIEARCREYLNGKIVARHGNGDFDYVFTVPDGEQFWFGVLLSFGADAQVLSPRFLIDRMTSICARILSLYDKIEGDPSATSEQPSASVNLP